MKKVNVIKNGVVVFSGSFETQELAEQYISYHTSKDNFGKGEYVRQVSPLIPANYDPQGNEITPEIPAIYETVPSEYTIVTEDITEAYEMQLAVDADIKQGEANRDACKRVLAFINGYNDGRLTAPQIQQQIQLFGQAKSLLDNDMPKTAKTVINSITVDGTLLTADMKAKALWLLKDF